MRTFRLIGMALVAMLMCVTSCSKDDEGEKQEEILISDLLGKWEITHSKGYELKSNGTKEEWDNEVSGEFFQFDKDNTGSSFMNNESNKSTFTWLYKDSKLSVTYSNSGDVWKDDYKITTLNATTLVMEVTEVKEDETEFEITTYKRISK